MKKIKFTPYLFISFIIVFILLTISCKSNNPEKNNNIRIEQLNTDYPVTFFKDNENGRMIRIFFRIPFQITSNITDNNTITSLSYYYSKEFGKPYLTMTAGWSSVLSYNSKTNESIRNFHEFNKNNPIYI